MAVDQEAPPLVGVHLARVTSWSLPPPSFLLPCQLELQVELQVAPPLSREKGPGQAGGPRTPNPGVELEGEASCCGRSKTSPAPPVSSPGTISPGACPCGAIGLVGSIEEEVAEFRAFCLTWFGAQHSCASGSAPPL